MSAPRGQLMNLSYLSTASTGMSEATRLHAVDVNKSIIEMRVYSNVISQIAVLA